MLYETYDQEIGFAVSETSLENSQRTPITLEYGKFCPFMEPTKKGKCLCKAIVLKSKASMFLELTYYDVLNCSTIWESCPNFKNEKQFLENHK